RGPKTSAPDPRDRELAANAREIARLTARVERAEAIIGLQKKYPRSWGSSSQKATTSRDRNDHRIGSAAQHRVHLRRDGSRPGHVLPHDPPALRAALSKN